MCHKQCYICWLKMDFYKQYLIFIHSQQQYLYNTIHCIHVESLCVNIVAIQYSHCFCVIY